MESQSYFSLAETFLDALQHADANRLKYEVTERILRDLLQYIVPDDKRYECLNTIINNAMKEWDL